MVSYWLDRLPAITQEGLWNSCSSATIQTGQVHKMAAMVIGINPNCSPLHLDASQSWEASVLWHKMENENTKGRTKWWCKSTSSLIRGLIQVMEMMTGEISHSKSSWYRFSVKESLSAILGGFFSHHSWSSSTPPISHPYIWCYFCRFYCKHIISLS